MGQSRTASDTWISPSGAVKIACCAQQGLELVDLQSRPGRRNGGKKPILALADSHWVVFGARYLYVAAAHLERARELFESPHERD